MSLPSPEDSWAQVELYLRQHKELPPQDGTDKPLSVPEGLRGMAEEIRDAVKAKDMSKCPPPFSVIAVLLYAAKLIEQNQPEQKRKHRKEIKTWKK